MKNSKKLLAIAAASTMLIGSAIGVTAATQSISNTATASITTADASGNYTTSLSAGGVVQTPTIKLIVPTASGIIINPYGMEAVKGTTAVTDQIISEIQTIANESDVPIKVDVTVVAQPGSGSAAVIASGTQAAKTTKSVCLIYEAVKGSAAPSTISAHVAVNKSADASVQLTSASAGVKASTVTLDKKDGTAPNYYFYVTGDAAKAPSIAWTAADTIDISYAFTFTPTLVQ